MDISVSSLGFCGYKIYDMGKLASDIGIEIFYEWGCETYWELALKEIFNGRSGDFSIHAPYQGDITEMSLTDRTDELFSYLKKPFDIYHMFNATSYVVHMNAPYRTVPTPDEKSERMKRVEDRLARFNDICKSNGVNMLVENLAYGRGLYTLCDQEDFLSIFERNPDLNCIVDTGHAVLGGIDILSVQKTLGSRLKAYHMHDNDGKEDLHERICTGVIDWKRFARGAKEFTPDAKFVLEYNAASVSSISDYMKDAGKIREMLNMA